MNETCGTCGGFTGHFNWVGDGAFHFTRWYFTERKGVTYRKALEFATKKHAGHKRRNGDNYIIHPIRVSQEVNTTRQKVIALLHDTIEDTDATYEEIKAEFGIEVADVVLCLTHHENEPYEKYIERVKTNEDAVAVKIADISDNLSDSPSDKAIKRSSAAIDYLVN